MPILSLIATSLIALPDPASMTQLERVAYPTRALRDDKSGAVQLRLWFDATGRSYRCEVERVFGDEAFGPAACKVYRKARIQAAKGPDGSPSFVTLRTTEVYLLSGHRRSEFGLIDWPPDIVLAGSSATVGQAAPDFRIAVQIRAEGTIDSCEGLEDATEALSTAACDAARRMAWPRGTDEAGQPMSYVASLRVAVQSSPET